MGNNILFHEPFQGKLYEGRGLFQAFYAWLTKSFQDNQFPEGDRLAQCETLGRDVKNTVYSEGVILYSLSLG